LKCVPEGNEPIDYFKLLVTDSIFDLIVEEINAYALDIFLNQTHKSSRINNWVDTNRKDMDIFVGLLFYMGTITHIFCFPFGKPVDFSTFRVFVSIRVVTDSC
jgi:hypothetical protein